MPCPVVLWPSSPLYPSGLLSSNYLLNFSVTEAVGRVVTWNFTAAASIGRLLHFVARVVIWDFLLAFGASLCIDLVGVDDFAPDC